MIRSLRRSALLAVIVFVLGLFFWYLSNFKTARESLLQLLLVPIVEATVSKTTSEGWLNRPDSTRWRVIVQHRGGRAIPEFKFELSGDTGRIESIVPQDGLPSGTQFRIPHNTSSELVPLELGGVAIPPSSSRSILLVVPVFSDRETIELFIWTNETKRLQVLDRMPGYSYLFWNDPEPSPFSFQRMTKILRDNREQLLDLSFVAVYAMIVLFIFAIFIRIVYLIWIFASRLVMRLAATPLLAARQLSFRGRQILLATPVDQRLHRGVDSFYVLVAEIFSLIWTLIEKFICSNINYISSCVGPRDRFDVFCACLLFYVFGVSTKLWDISIIEAIILYLFATRYKLIADVSLEVYKYFLRINKTPNESAKRR